jgi:hypothetical protein
VADRGARLFHRGRESRGAAPGSGHRFDISDSNCRPSGSGSPNAAAAVSEATFLTCSRAAASPPPRRLRAAAARPSSPAPTRRRSATRRCQDRSDRRGTQTGTPAPVKRAWIGTEVDERVSWAPAPPVCPRAPSTPDAAETALVILDEKSADTVLAHPARARRPKRWQRPRMRPICDHDGREASHETADRRRQPPTHHAGRRERLPAFRRFLPPPSPARPARPRGFEPLTFGSVDRRLRRENGSSKPNPGSKCARNAPEIGGGYPAGAAARRRHPPLAASGHSARPAHSLHGSSVQPS